MAFPDRSFLVATLRYFGRLGKRNCTAWEFNLCFYIFSAVPLDPAALNKVLFAKMNRTDSWVGCGLKDFTWDHFEPFYLQLLWLQRKSVPTWVLQCACWAARLTARYCTYPYSPHGFGYVPIKTELTHSLAAGNLTKQCLGKGMECNDRQQGTWWLVVGTSIIQAPNRVLFWPPTLASISWQDILLLVPRT